MQFLCSSFSSTALFYLISDFIPSLPNKKTVIITPRGGLKVQRGLNNAGLGSVH